MSSRVWAYVFVALLVVGGAIALATTSHNKTLRSEHAHPTEIALDQTVSVNVEGNLFHQATCKDLHKPTQSMPAAAAIAKGYAPCTRCMKQALAK
jgi:hypothetical protein